MLLNYLANKYGSDKGSVEHGFCRVYEQHFATIKELCRLQHRSPCILEIGVFEGASVKMYEEYFEGNVIVHAIDIEDKHQYDTECVTTHICDQSDLNKMENLLKHIGIDKYDIIIDDGSHYWSHQINSMLLLSKYVLPIDGIYIVEDVHTSYFMVSPYNDVRSLSWEDSTLYFLQFFAKLNNKYADNKYYDYFVNNVRDIVTYNLHSDHHTILAHEFNNRENVTAILTFNN